MFDFLAVFLSPFRDQILSVGAKFEVCQKLQEVFLSVVDGIT